MAIHWPTQTRLGTAELNLPIRQGYVLCHGKGRAEVEFENGAMAFLKENTVLEFYDLRSMTAHAHAVWCSARAALLSM